MHKKYVSFTKGKIVVNSDIHHHEQVLHIDIINTGTKQYHVPPDIDIMQWEGNKITSAVLLTEKKKRIG